jgi:hypothetical protein
LRYFIALLKSDTAGMRRDVAQVTGKQGVEDVMSHAESLVLARSGRLQEARISRVAVDLAHNCHRPKGNSTGSTADEERRPGSVRGQASPSHETAWPMIRDRP